MHYTTIFLERTAVRKKIFQPRLRRRFAARLTRFATLGDNAGHGNG